MKRRVYHLAKKAGLEANLALKILREAGFNTNNVDDQISTLWVNNALAVLGQRSSRYIKYPSVLSDTKLIAPPRARNALSTENEVNIEIKPNNVKQATSTSQVKRSKETRVHYLEINDLLGIHFALVEMFAKDNDPIYPPGPKDKGLLESATHRPRTALGQSEKYPSIRAKAAALFHSMVKNHPFHNGNKRTALVSLLVFLDKNGFLIDASDDDLFTFVINTAKTTRPESGSGTSDKEVATIENWIRTYSIRATTNTRDMRTSEFLRAIELAGGHYRESANGSCWTVWGLNKDGSVTISKSSKKLGGNVVKKYLQKIGLSYGRTGISFDEFEEGLDPNQLLIRNFRNVLKRLANA